MIPKVIEIGSYKIPVEFEDKSTMADILGQFVPVDGPNTPRIRIRAEMEDQATLETFIHEVIEGVEAIYDIGLTHPQVQILGVAITQVLKEMLQKV